MTPEERDAIRARLDAASPGPWEAHHCDVFAESGDRDVAETFYPSDADLIAHAPADLAALLDEVERLTRWKAEATEVISAWERLHDDLGKPGAFGESKAAATRREVERLTAEREKWTHGFGAEVLDDIHGTVTGLMAERDAARAALAAFRADVETLRAIGADSYHGCVAAKALAALLAKHAEEDA